MKYKPQLQKDDMCNKNIIELPVRFNVIRLLCDFHEI